MNKEQLIKIDCVHKDLKYIISPIEILFSNNSSINDSSFYHKIAKEISKDSHYKSLPFEIRNFTSSTLNITSTIPKTEVKISSKGISKQSDNQANVRPFVKFTNSDKNFNDNKKLRNNFMDFDKFYATKYQNAPVISNKGYFKPNNSTLVFNVRISKAKKSIVFTYHRNPQFGRNRINKIHEEQGNSQTAKDKKCSINGKK